MLVGREKFCFFSCFAILRCKGSYFEVLGDSQTRRTDVRVVCATNADPSSKTCVHRHTSKLTSILPSLE